jgi:hypothetical protein
MPDMLVAMHLAKQDYRNTENTQAYTLVLKAIRIHDPI